MLTETGQCASDVRTALLTSAASPSQPLQVHVLPPFLSSYLSPLFLSASFTLSSNEANIGAFY